MTLKNMRAKHLKVLAVVLALMLASGNVLLSAPGTRAQGIDLAGIDKSTDPGDDFFGYANGTWSRAAQIPSDRPSYGAFDAIAEKVNARTADLIRSAGKSANDPEAQKIGDYYDAFMNEEAIEKKGLAPIKTELDEINGIADKTALARVLGSQLRADVDPLNSTNFYTDRLFGIWVSPDFNNPTHNIAYMLQGGLGLPDRDNYLGTEKDDVELQAKYREHIVTILKLARVADAEARAARIYDLEKMIATAHATRTDSADVQKANNPWATKDFSTKAPGLDWTTYFKAAGLSAQPTIIVWHPGGVAGISRLVGSQPLDVWKEYLTFHVIDRSSGLLPKPFATERFKFYGTTLNGIPQQSDRWKRAISNTSAGLGDAVGKLYVQKYFPPEAKARIQEMVKNIIAAFGRRIDNLTWMTPATKAKAKAKLGTLYVGVGYPEHWRDYAGLKILRDDPLGNAQRSDLFDYQWTLSKLSKPVDKTEWWMTPQTVNAVNLPIQNGLNFPAAILNPPFFDPSADPVENYGSIGATIGHEISHSFDDQGSQFDAYGKLQNWWTPADLEHFRAAADRLAAQFDAYEPLPGMHVNGKLTLSENIADVAGLSAAYDAYRTAYGDKPSANAKGLTNDQRFFIAYAQSWRSKVRPEFLKVLLTTDGHAPDQYRADTVRNLDAWYQAFNIQPGRKLYLAPEARVRVW
ncbi:MAG TPA: M13 family metallopeptidase [Pyrinomonadaceae bacterium]|jgi:putative endopeptidase|nr:M13 family metallopeptidase [Pyrinomonadaceae bacterium]